MYYLKKLLEKVKIKIKKIKSDEHLNEIYSGSLYVFIAKTIATVLGLLSSIVVVRYYGADIMGSVALITSFYAVMTVFTLLGTNTSVMRLIPEYTIKYSPNASYTLFKKIITVVVILSIFFTIILFFGSDIIADKIFNSPELTFIFAIASILIVFKTLQNFTLNGLRAIQKIKAYAFVLLFGPILNLLLLIAITFIYFDKHSPIYIQFIIIVLMATLSMLIIVRDFHKKIKFDNTKISITYKRIVQISFPMFLTNSMAIFMGELTTLIAGYFLSTTDVGYYAIALRIALLTTFVLQAVNTVVAPKFAELYHKGLIDELFRIAKQSTRLIFFTALPFLLILLFFGKWLIITFYGQEFEISYSLLLILMTGLFINAISGSVGSFMNMCGYEKIFRNVMGIAVLINVGANILLIPKIGIYGAAISTSITQAFWSTCLTIYIYRKHKKVFLYLPFIKI